MCARNCKKSVSHPHPKKAGKVDKVNQASYNPMDIEASRRRSRPARHHRPDTTPVDLPPLEMQAATAEEGEGVVVAVTESRPSTVIAILSLAAILIAINRRDD